MGCTERCLRTCSLSQPLPQTIGMNRKTYPRAISVASNLRLSFPCWKVPVNAQRHARWTCTMSRAILYLQRTGCSWRALPGDFPKWRTVHSYFQRWTEPRESGISILEEALKKSGSCGAPQAGAP